MGQSRKASGIYRVLLSHKVSDKPSLKDKNPPLKSANPQASVSLCVRVNRAYVPIVNYL
jgi:hypothetical protein